MQNLLSSIAILREYVELLKEVPLVFLPPLVILKGTRNLSVGLKKGLLKSVQEISAFLTVTSVLARLRPRYAVEI